MQSVAPPAVAVGTIGVSSSFYLRVCVTELSEMELSKKVKTALDETRMLILGAQILLGFELRAAFSEGFDKLPGHARHIEALALMLDGDFGRADDRARAPITALSRAARTAAPSTGSRRSSADLALLPFGLALGLDVFVSIEHVFGSAAGHRLRASAQRIVALGLWYGMPRAAAQQDRRERADYDGTPT